MLDPSLIPLVQRLDRDPEDGEAIETLHRALDACGEHEVLARLLEKVAGRRRSPEGSVELMHRAALIWSGKAGDDGRALPLWSQVLEAQPEHEGAMLGTAAIFRRSNRAEQAEALYRRVLERAVSPVKKVPVLESLAVLFNERDLPEREIETRRELAVQQGPGAAATTNRRSLAKLLVERSRRRTAAIPLAEGEVDPDAREAAALLGAVAREGETGRGTEFAQAALSLWAGDESAFEVMEESATLKASNLTTLRIQFLAANPQGARGQRVRRDLAEAYLATQRPEDAVTVLAAAVDEDPQAAQSLAKLYERLQRHVDLAQLLDRFPTPTEAEPRVVLLRRRAQAWRATGQKGPHLAALRALLEEVPADGEALAEVERDCRLQGLLGELRDRLRAAAAVEDGDVAARVRWLREVAQLAERRFDDPADARAAWEALERVTDKAEDRAEAHDALLRLMARGEDWDSVIERLAAQAEAEPDAAESLRRWMRWVQVRRERRPDAAREVAVLEKLWAQHPDDDGVARALVDARRRTGDDIGVTEVLYALIERAGAGNAASRWCQLAEHLERVGDLESSAEAWQSARMMDPTSGLAWEAEARLLGAMGDREGELTALVAYADHPVAGGRRAGELYARAAQLAFELGRKERAGQLAERALRFAPDDDAMKSLVATLDDPGTAPVLFEELLAEAARQEAASTAANEETIARDEAAAREVEQDAAASEADERTGLVLIEHEGVEEPTAAVMIDYEGVEEPTGVVLIETVEAILEATTGAVATVASVEGKSGEEVPAELSDDLLEEIVPEASTLEPEPEPEPTVSTPPSLLDSEEQTPVDGVRLPEMIATTVELAAPVLPPVVAAQSPDSMTAEPDPLPIPPSLNVASMAPSPSVVAPPPVASDEDSMIFDESLFADSPLPPPLSIAPPSPSVVPPSPSISTAIPPSMPFLVPPALISLPPPPPPLALQFNPQPIVDSLPPPPALQFNPQPVAELASQSSQGDPFNHGAGDWAIDASGDPFAERSAPAASPPPVAVELPDLPPPAAPAAFAFERVLLPMYETLLGERHG